MSGADFNAGTLSTIEDCIAKVASNINRGVLSGTSKPTENEVQTWLIDAKQRLQEAHNFTWQRIYVYMDTTTDEFRYALPADFQQGGHIIRDTSNDIRLVYVDSVSFDSVFIDPGNDNSSTPEYYTIKDREIWLAQPASGAYRLELEYSRSGDDSTPTDISYLPELMRFKMCEYATYRAFLSLQMWEGANAYKSLWEQGIGVSKSKDTRKRWAAMGYQARRWFI